MKLYILWKVLKIHALLKIPAMTRKERKIYKRILTSLPVDQKLDIFEYGSGCSTIYYSKYLKRKRIPFHLHSVDNNPFWHNKVIKMTKASHLDNLVTLHLCEFLPIWERINWDFTQPIKPGQFAPANEGENQYINKLKELDIKFDVIFVDGRFRRRCLEIAKNYLKPHGVVILHDAERVFYHEPLSEFKHSEFVNSGKFFPFERRKHQMWVGSHDNPVIHEVVEAKR